MSQGKSAEEDEKRLSTLLMAGDSVIVLDNCERAITLQTRASTRIARRARINRLDDPNLASGWIASSAHRELLVRLDYRGPQNNLYEAVDNRKIS